MGAVLVLAGIAIGLMVAIVIALAVETFGL